MEYFIRRGIQGEELAELNICQIYLQATRLSDLATLEGKSTYPTFWFGNLNLMNPKYKWTLKPMSHQKSWENWQVDLQFTYNLSISLSLPVHQRLGPQLYVATSTGWI